MGLLIIGFFLGKVRYIDRQIIFDSSSRAVLTVKLCTKIVNILLCCKKVYKRFPNAATFKKPYLGY